MSLNFSLRSAAAALALAGLLAFSSCSDDSSTVTATPPQLTVINLSPIPDTAYDVYVNKAILLPGLPYKQTSTGTGTYLSLPSSSTGFWTIDIRRPGTAIIRDTTPNAAFLIGRRYTACIYDTGSNTNIILLDDAYPTPSASTAKVRFVQVVSGVTDTVDLIVDGQVVAYGIAYGRYTTFIDVEQGSHTLNLRASGSGTNFYPQDQTVNFQAGKGYTVYGTGVYPNTSGARAVTTLTYAN